MRRDAVLCDMGVRYTEFGTGDNICIDTQSILGKAMLCLSLLILRLALSSTM